MKRLSVLVLILLLSLCTARANAESVEAVETPMTEDEATLEGALVILYTACTQDLADETILERALLARSRFEELGASVILLDAGNTLSDAASELSAQDEATLLLMNAAPYDAFVPALADLCQDKTRLSAVQNSAEFSVLTGAEHMLIERNGLKVGLIGSSDACADEKRILRAVQTLTKTHCDAIILTAGQAAQIDSLTTAPEISVIIDNALTANEPSASAETPSDSDVFICPAYEGLNCIVLMPNGERTALLMTDDWFDAPEGDTFETEAEDESEAETQTASSLQK